MNRKDGQYWCRRKDRKETSNGGKDHENEFEEESEKVCKVEIAEDVENETPTKKKMQSRFFCFQETALKPVSRRAQKKTDSIIH